MSNASVLSPERRIELNPFDVDAWNLLLRESSVSFFEIYLVIGNYKLFCRLDPLIKQEYFMKNWSLNFRMLPGFGKPTSNMKFEQEIWKMWKRYDLHVLFRR